MKKMMEQIDGNWPWGKKNRHFWESEMVGWLILAQTAALVDDFPLVCSLFPEKAKHFRAGDRENYATTAGTLAGTRVGGALGYGANIFK